MADNDGGGGGGGGGGPNASARILQLECILASKDRELEVLRREYAGLGPSAEDAAESARLRRRIAELEQRALLAAAADEAAAAASLSSSGVPSPDPIAHALQLSRQLERLLALAARASPSPVAAANPVVAGAAGGGAASEAPAASDAPAAPSSSAPAQQVVESSMPMWMMRTRTTTGAQPAAVSSSSSSHAGTAAAENADAATARQHARGNSSPELLRAPPALCLPPVLSLNVSGVAMDLLTASLSQLAPASRLARMLATLEDFEGKLGSSTPREVDHSLPRDATGRVFLPYPPDCFAAVLDMLHMRLWWPGRRGGAGDLGAQPAAAGGSAAATSSTLAPRPAPPRPPPPLPETWRDRVSPARQAILRELIVELGLEALVADSRARAGPYGAAGGSGVLGGPPLPPAPGNAGNPASVASVGDMYLRMAALGR